MPLDEYRRVNLENWNDRAEIHAESRGYNLAGYISDPARLSGVVQFDREYVGDVNGKSLLHLQCHIGTDTISWARLGAQVTGIDFSPDAIAVARKLSADSGTPARFEVAELYDTPTVINETFDIVYTGVGALCWLPDIAAWGKIVSTMLKPGGTFYIREFHPMQWALDDERDDDLLVVKFPYFETSALRFEADTTYTDGRPLNSKVNYEWNHGLSEVIMALLDNGLRLEHIAEFKFSDSKSLPFLVADEDGRWRLPEGAERLPMMYSLRAVKPG